MLKRSVLTIALGLVAACGAKSPPPAPEPGAGTVVPDGAIAEACTRTGCSGTVCAPAGSDIVTTCEYRAEFACYRDARCEQQASGECGFTQTAELTACLASPPAE